MNRFADNQIDFEKEIKQSRFMSYQEFCEIKMMTVPDEEGFCYRCNSPLEPLTYLEPNFYYCPCWNCISKKRTEQDAVAEGIVRNIKEFYSKLIGDRYYQLFLVDDIYFRTTLPHDYGMFKKVVNSLSPPNRNDIWFLDWIPGYPKIISMENLGGIKIVDITKLYGNIHLDKDKVVVGDFEIRAPEFVSFDNKHHYRYSILNPRGDRKSKRLKLGDQCVKFYNTEDDDIKSIFKVYRNGEEMPIRNLTHQDYVIIKLAIMRDKTFIKLVFDIILEICKSVGNLRDSVFLKNTVMIDKRKSGSGLNVYWCPISEYVEKDNNYINISII